MRDGSAAAIQKDPRTSKLVVRFLAIAPRAGHGDLVALPEAVRPLRFDVCQGVTHERVNARSAVAKRLLHRGAPSPGIHIAFPTRWRRAEGRLVSEVRAPFHPIPLSVRQVV